MASDLVHRSAFNSSSSKAVLLRDQQSMIPLTNVLSDGDLLILLSPVVAPSIKQDAGQDPFESLGRALAARHAWVRHVPYTANGGITDVHAAFIQKARVVIFIIAGAVIPGRTSQIDMAEIARIMAENRPLVIVACQHERELHLEPAEFGTVLQVPGYEPRQLEQAAAVLFDEDLPNAPEARIREDSNLAPKQWEVEALPDSLHAYDVSPIVELWNESLPAKFQLNQASLRGLLDRDGFGRHYSVKSPQTGRIIGFCATYTTWAFSDPEYLVGSLAVLMVKPEYRELGIGLSLYNHATDLLTRTRGVKRLHIGSTFPRLLLGIPRELASQAWFRRRGWDLDSGTSGGGKEICDWRLKIQDWPSGGLGSIPEGFAFRQCTPDDFPDVLEFIRNAASRNETMGLFEAYKWSRDCTQDIVLAFHGPKVVAAALTYMANSGSTVEYDIPWARKLGPYVGGITCICITEDDSFLQRYRNSVMIRLLGTCIELLESYGMQEVFLDGIRGGDQGFEDLGFRKWALYRDVWEPLRR